MLRSLKQITNKTEYKGLVLAHLSVLVQMKSELTNSCDTILLSFLNSLPDTCLHSPELSHAVYLIFRLFTKYLKTSSLI